MNIVIVGAGKVGETLVKNFTNENHDIVVVDVNSETVSNVVNRYDVMGIVGGGLERSVLTDAGVAKADFLIACTSRDEMNILCCVLARKLGAKRTVARVRDPEYFKEVDGIRGELGLDFAFNPELATANEIAQVLKFPSAINVESFAGGKATMAEFEISKDNPINGRTLMEIATNYSKKILVAMVCRGEEVFIPRGDFVIKSGDRIHIIATESEIVAFCKRLKIFKPRAKSVFIVGGGKIAYYLSQMLLSSGVDVKIVENNEQRANELSAMLLKATVLFGDGSNNEFLDEENLKNNDACVTLTGMDEENVIISLYAKQAGVGKVITKIDRPSLVKMVSGLGLDTVVSPRNVIANHIVRFVRAHQVEASGGIDTLYKLHDKVEAAEFTVGESFSAIGKSLKEISIKQNVLIGGIVRGDKFIQPSGDSKLEKGDKVVVVTAASQITELAQILK